MKNYIIDSNFEKLNKNNYNLDLYSKLLKERIIFIIGEICDDTASLIINQLLYLEAENPISDINIYINSNGGSVSSGMAIYDTMNYIKPDISTLCIGVAFSMGAFLLSSGKKGKRYSMPNSRLMIHQPLGGFHGQVSDILIHTKEMHYLKKILTKLLSYNTDKTYKRVKKDTDRDNFMSPTEALSYGLIDHILLTKD